VRLLQTSDWKRLITGNQPNSSSAMHQSSNRQSDAEPKELHYARCIHCWLIQAKQLVGGESMVSEAMYHVYHNILMVIDSPPNVMELFQKELSI
jgi:hypothetical protein